MASVVDKFAGLDLNPAQLKAREQLEGAEKILSQEKTSKPARLAKLAALVDLDEFQAVTSFADVAHNKEELVPLSYALYRLGDLKQLRSLVTEHSHIGARLALAQAEYKAGHLKEAQKQLQNCYNEVSSEDIGDIDVNLSAIDALQGIAAELSSEIATFDQVFNSACAHLTRGLTSDALKLLQNATGLAEEEDDRQAAVSQAAYAYLVADNREKSLELLETLHKSDTPLPLALQIVVANNKLAASYKGGDLLAAHKALVSLDSYFKRQVKFELNADQRQIIQRNALKLLARVGISKVVKRALKHQTEFPSDVEPLSLAYHFTKSLKYVRKAAAGGDVAAKVCLAAVENNEWKYSDHQTSQPQLGDFGYLADAALQAWRGGNNNLSQLDEYFESLRIPELTEAGRALLSTKVDITDEALASIDHLVASVDAESLNNNATSNTISKPVKAASTRRRSGKRKLPASYDPDRQPDPERWLAKQDRSGYKAKKKKTSQATQGAAVTHDEPVAPSTSQVVVGSKTKKKNNKKKSKK